MKPNKHEPEVEIVISDATVRFTMAVFLALLALGAALLIWRGLSSVPDGDHRIDQTTGALRAFSTFAAILLVLYLVIAARVFSERLDGQMGLRYQQGLAEGRKQVSFELVCYGPVFPHFFPPPYPTTGPCLELYQDVSGMYNVT